MSFHIFEGIETYDGAGVKLKRIFGTPAYYNITDPFLLLDYFGSNKPSDYQAGFPWHPHRGIQTITYVIKGRVDHEDSLGYRDTIRSGEIQWMNAGSGIFHQEMPMGDLKSKELWGFQLWINLPRVNKMSKPSYRSINSSNVRTIENEKIRAKIISGNIMDSDNGALEFDPGITYVDIEMKSDKITLKNRIGYTSLIIPLYGKINFKGFEINQFNVLCVSDDYSDIEIMSTNKSRFLFISGERINEEIAWYGPIVMNNWSEIEQSFLDLKNGNFIRDKSPIFIE